MKPYTTDGTEYADLETTMSPDALREHPDYYIHHIASRRGYVSRRSDGRVEEYEGRFGKGFILEEPRWDTNQYTCITYYIHK